MLLPFPRILASLETQYMHLNAFKNDVVDISLIPRPDTRGAHHIGVLPLKGHRHHHHHHLGIWDAMTQPATRQVLVCLGYHLKLG